MNGRIGHCAGALALTNTFPNWERAHLYRYVIHNGEINTGAAMKTGCTLAKVRAFASIRDKLQEVFPVIRGRLTRPTYNALELLHLGRSPRTSMMMVPEPEKHEHERREARFYELTLLDGTLMVRLYRLYRRRSRWGVRSQRLSPIPLLRDQRRHRRLGLDGVDICRKTSLTRDVSNRACC